MDTVKAHGAEQATDGWKPITAGVASTPLVRYGAKLVLHSVLLKILPVGQLPVFTFTLVMLLRSMFRPVNVPVEGD